MLYLEPIIEPQAQQHLNIQRSIINSHPSFNQVVLGKQILSFDDIEKDNDENLKLGAIYFYIKNGVILLV